MYEPICVGKRCCTGSFRTVSKLCPSYEFHNFISYEVLLVLLVATKLQSKTGFVLGPAHVLVDNLAARSALQAEPV